MTFQIIYPKLRLHSRTIIKKYIEEIEEKVKKNVLSLIDMEMAYMNTHKLDFRAAANVYVLLLLNSYFQ